MNKIAVFGAGAIGGLLAARLAQSGRQVSVVARGATLDALQSKGIVLQEQQQGAWQEITQPVRAVADAQQLGVQDVLILSLKAPALPEVLPQLAHLIGPDTLILAAMNGVPWWFFATPDVPLHGVHLPALDKDGRLSQALPVAQTMGCVVHLSAACPQPGVVRLAMGNRLIIGEPDGADSARLAQLAQILREARFEVDVSHEIRTQIWYKLWGNMTMNPISALTGATGDKILDDHEVNRFCLDVMAEAAAIGARIGCPIAQSGADRMAITRKLGALRTSMLQDVEAGKPIELDALVTVVQQIGRELDMPTPYIDVLLGLTRVFAQTRGLYHTA
ncbi:2-dehydropantoate 2-reductase [Massilia sp. W12]|uniref:2-dehydropantoate 2-reductase n=1 Tax=Massilia sp. W12 TaxID=3126507 RepID=UPI0030D4BABA